MDKLKKIGDNIGCVLFAIIFLGIILLFVSIFSGSIMRVFGFEYDSFGSIMLFMLILEVVSFPADVLVNGLSAALVEIDLIGKFGSKVVKGLLDVSINIFTILLVDYFMDSVKVSPVATLVISVIWAMFEFFFVNVKIDTEDNDEDDDEDDDEINENM